uniref:Uncharacterized protein n=1 Tax=Hyaloperonospora arabidopsidis (strain Emoy2) TaxID=559515 RepID=M4BDP9_HYAAE
MLCWPTLTRCVTRTSRFCSRSLTSTCRRSCASSRFTASTRTCRLRTSAPSWLQVWPARSCTERVSSSLRPCQRGTWATWRCNTSSRRRRCSVSCKMCVRPNCPTRRTLPTSLLAVAFVLASTRPTKGSRIAPSFVVLLYRRRRLFAV